MDSRATSNRQKQNIASGVDVASGYSHGAALEFDIVIVEEVVPFSEEDYERLVALFASRGFITRR